MDFSETTKLDICTFCFIIRVLTSVTYQLTKLGYNILSNIHFDG